METAVFEPIRHGSPEKNIAFYNHVFTPGEKGVYRGFVAHWHPEYEIIYVFSGPASFMVDGRICCVQSGQALFLDKNMIHASVPSAPSSIRYVCVTFGEQFPFSSTMDALYKEYFFPLHLEHKQIPCLIRGDCAWQKEVLSIFRQLCRSGLEKKRGCELEWRILLLRFFYTAYTCDVFIPREQGREESITAVQSALLAIREHYAETISVSALAGKLGYSAEHFCRVFKSVTGRTPTEYINIYRMQKAEYLLAHTADSISDIALACGFNDINYFSRYFKKIHQITPSQYRKECAV